MGSPRTPPPKPPSPVAGGGAFFLYSSFPRGLSVGLVYLPSFLCVCPSGVCPRTPPPPCPPPPPPPSGGGAIIVGGITERRRGEGGGVSVGCCPLCGRVLRRALPAALKGALCNIRPPLRLVVSCRGGFGGWWGAFWGVGGGFLGWSSPLVGRVLRRALPAALKGALCNIRPPLRLVVSCRGGLGVLMGAFWGVGGGFLGGCPPPTYPPPPADPPPPPNRPTTIEEPPPPTTPPRPRNCFRRGTAPAAMQVIF